jgi:RNA polymerase sigma-70 factor (ECF subfamily)
MRYSVLQADELIRVCLDAGETGAWEEFVRRFNPLIARVALRTSRRWGNFPPSVVEDLVQEIYLKLCAERCRLLRQFNSTHPDAIYGFLKVVATNVVHDYFKTHFAAKRGRPESAEGLDIGEAAEPTSAPNSPTALSLIERTILLRQVDSFLARIVPSADLARSRLIFWLYYRCGLSARAIASLPSSGLTTKGVESVLFRLTQSLSAALDQHPQSDSGKASEAPKGLSQADSL